MAQSVPTKAFLQPAKAAAMCTAPHVYLPLYPTFFATQNLLSKWIAPTDNIRPKMHDEYNVISG